MGRPRKRKPSPLTAAISVGQSVEVCSREDGFLGSYWEAKVLAKSGKDKFKVEYKNLVEDDEAEEKQKLTEVVHVSELRPKPGKIRVSGFNVLDKVDAFDRDGWWVGRVTGRVNDKYFVYFDSSGDELEYSFDQIRVHQEWDNGKWVLSQR